jgi:hypothetical protein
MEPTAKVLSRTYSDRVCPDPWERVLDRRRVRGYAERPDTGRTRVGRALDLSPGRARGGSKTRSPTPTARSPPPSSNCSRTSSPADEKTTLEQLPAVVWDVPRSVRQSFARTYVRHRGLKYPDRSTTHVQVERHDSHVTDRPNPLTVL